MTVCQSFMVFMFKGIDVGNKQIINEKLFYQVGRHLICYHSFWKTLLGCCPMLELPGIEAHACKSLSKSVAANPLSSLGGLHFLFRPFATT